MLLPAFFFPSKLQNAAGLRIYTCSMRMSLIFKTARTAARLRFMAGQLLSRAFALCLGGKVCLCCGRPSAFLPVCGDCVRTRIMAFRPPSQSRCGVCGRPLLGEAGVCMTCRREPVFLPVDGVFPLHGYRLWYKNLLFAWKMEGERSLSPVFAAAVHRALGLLYGGGEVPCLVPVPPRPGKIRATGWDQVDELCRLLSVLFGYRVERLLVRLSGEQQKKKSRWERHGMRCVYGPSRRFTQLKRRDIIPQEVVLIDDLITSGATVCECADILKRGFVEKVKVLSLFIVD